MQKTIVTTLFLALVALCLYPYGKHQLAEAKSSCANWRKDLKRHKLLLPSTQRKRLLRIIAKQKRPLPTRKHRSLIKRYHVLLQRLQRVRLCYKRAYRRLRTKKQRLRMIREIDRTMVAILSEAVMPLWLGTPWHYYGTAQKPHEKAVACGYFVTHMLRAIGFSFPENFLYTARDGEVMRIFEYAKLSAKKMALFVTSPALLVEHADQTPATMLPKLRRMGAGIYILGLDDHVGMVLFDGKRAYFWHSSDWVKREALSSSADVKGSRVHVLGKIRPSAWVGWMRKTPIVVKKTKPTTLSRKAKR